MAAFADFTLANQKDILWRIAVLFEVIEGFWSELKSFFISSDFKSFFVAVGFFGFFPLFEKGAVGCEFASKVIGEFFFYATWIVAHGNYDLRIVSRQLLISDLVNRGLPEHFETRVLAFPEHVNVTDRERIAEFNIVGNISYTEFENGFDIVIVLNIETCAQR